MKQQLTGININQIQKTCAQNQYWNHLVDPSFQGVNRLFVLFFEKEKGRTAHAECYIPKVEMKNYNVTIDGQNFFDQAINNVIKTSENIRKNATGQGDDCLFIRSSLL